MDTPRIAVGPRPKDDSGAGWAVQAIRDGGGEPVGVDDEATAVVWLDPLRFDGLGDLLKARPGIRWVQLPLAGVERLAGTGLLDAERIWTCAKGSYAEPVAEHALTLALAGLRDLPTRLRATSWAEESGTSLYDEKVTILGGGGITEELLRLLAPWRVEATVVRRRADPVPGAARTVSTGALDDVLPGALVIFVALALTPGTTGIVGRRQLELMDDRAWLVNVARGAHVDTDALTAALAAGSIAGAAIDVTDPEPLPDGHPLWTEPRCIVTPHTADTWDMIKPHLAARIRANVAHFAVGESLEGLVDPVEGY